MSAPDPARRRFLALVAGLAGIGAATAVLGRRRPEPSLAAQTTSTTEPPAATETSAAGTPTSVTTTTTPPQVELEVLCREAWRAEPAREGLEPHAIERLTVHHTAAPISRAADAPRHILGHQRFHQNDRGWADIAYHFLIDPDGNVYQGRDPAYRGDTATEYDPAGHFLVCLDGDFDSATPTVAQIEALVDMLAYGAVTYGVDPTRIGGHRDYASTSCPGDTVYRLLEDGSLAERVAARARSAALRLRLVCGDEGAARIAAIEA